MASKEAQALFQWGQIRSAAGLDLDFKIECDALTNDDWDCIARACLPNLPKFKAVVPVPRGGIPLARAFEPHITPDAQVTLIVDDVWTTGQSFMEVAKTIDYWAGCVAFCRTYLPPGVLAFMRLDIPPKRLRVRSVMSNPNVCDHGSLRRQCPHCDVIEAEKRISSLEAENRRMREALDDIHMHGFEVGANVMVPKVEWDAAFARAALSQEEKP